nr:MAG TPA: hypothetical protein [Caudoviricetes sp.]
MDLSIKKSPHSLPASLSVRNFSIRNNHSKGRFLVPILPEMRKKYNVGRAITKRKV